MRSLGRLALIEVKLSRRLIVAPVYSSEFGARFDVGGGRSIGAEQVLVTKSHSGAKTSVRLHLGELQPVSHFVP
jgi:hypothetical protein